MFEARHCSWELSVRRTPKALERFLEKESEWICCLPVSLCLEIGGGTRTILPTFRKEQKALPGVARCWESLLFLLVHWQLGNLNDAILVLQLNVPLFMRYSFVYQNVQSFTGSTLMLL